MSDLTKAAVLVVLLMSGCSSELTDEEIIKAVKKCEDAGFAVEYRADFYGKPYSIWCSPRKKS